MRSEAAIDETPPRSRRLAHIARRPHAQPTTIEASFTHFPGVPHQQSALAERLASWLPEEKLGLARQLFKRACVTERHLLLPPDEAMRMGRSFATKNDLYRDAVDVAASELARQIVSGIGETVLASVDLLITVSCTGFQIPAVDARLIPALGLRTSVRRVNLTQHGCAGGAQALGLAHEWLQARPSARALVVAIEFCSLAFQPEDVSDENLVSAAIFGDGCAAVLLAGERAAGLRGGGPAERVRIADVHREFFPGTTHFMGFDINESGLKIKLSRDVVDFSRRELRGLLRRACDVWCLPGPEAIAFGALHPGGRRILELLEEGAGLSRQVTKTSWDCLRRYGNLSSASVLVTLHETLARSAEASVPPSTCVESELGLVTAFGPGFGAELLLLERELQTG